MLCSSRLWLAQGREELWRSYFAATQGQVALHQGGRTWQAFGGGKNGHETFRQARIYNFQM